MISVDVVAAIDTEITHLQHIRSLLSEVTEEVPGITKRGPGRPKLTLPPALKTVIKKRALSPEGRANIIAAQKKRHAALKKAKKQS